MPEQKRKFLDNILDPKSPMVEETKSYTTEHQHAAQALTLHIEYRDGRKGEGLAWSHYIGYRWRDAEDGEQLIVLFTERAVEIEGLNLLPLVDGIREGQLNSIRELSSSKSVLLKQSNPEGQPIIESVTTYPDFDEIMKTIKGEDDVQTRKPKRTQG